MKKLSRRIIGFSILLIIISVACAGIENSDSSKIEIKQKVWQAGQTPKQALNDVSAMFADTERRLRAVETYVTSSTFKLNAELDKL
jgi:phage shock protein C